jgi:hypothetical protein
MPSAVRMGFERAKGKAARCLALAAKLPPSPEAKMLTIVGQEYLAIALEQKHVFTKTARH